jgi:hypothetical protein
MTERSTTAFTLVKGATKSAVAPPTFRFSGLRCSVRLRSAPSVTCAGTSSRPLADTHERTRMRRKRRRVPGHRPHRSTQGFRKPMLYPLSYEGLRCAFVQHAGRVLVRRARAGCLPQTVCAASVPRAVDEHLTTASTRGVDCTVGDFGPRAEPVERWGSSMVAVRRRDARRVAVAECWFGRCRWVSAVVVMGCCLSWWCHGGFF